MPLDGAEIVLLGIYYASLCVVTVYATHRARLLRLHVRATRDRRDAIAPMSDWPSVTVQLPVYDEPYVVERLLRAAAAIDYPGALDIQVLDDSSDETTEIVARLAGELQRPDRRIDHVRRGSREGFKAGALAHGMTLSRAELFAIFDADFVPGPDSLTRMVRHFLDPEVGMVQARWGHLNREESALTAAQAIFLDAHFAIESAARFGSGRFFNFNGTAGIWRRQAIEDAGGWSSTTVTEDLDLSYRAQLAGWRFVFVSDVEVPSELPASLSGFRDQQFRWAKGSIQTAVKLLPSILTAPLPLSVRSEAWFHLTGNVSYPLTLLLALLIVPVNTVRMHSGLEWLLPVDALLFAGSTGSVLAFYIGGQRALGRPRPPLRTLLTLLPIGMSLAVRNSAAVIEGILGPGGTFERTPKRGGATRVRQDRPPRAPAAELIVFAFLAVSIVAFVEIRGLASLPFVLLFASGFGYASFAGLRERLRRGTRAGEEEGAGSRPAENLVPES